MEIQIRELAHRMATLNDYDSLNWDKIGRVEYDGMVERLHWLESEMWDVHWDLSVEDSEEEERQDSIKFFDR